MSSWYEIASEDIEIDLEQKEFNLHVGFDDSGNNYATLSFDQIKIMAEEIDRITNKQ